VDFFGITCWAVECGRQFMRVEKLGLRELKMKFLNIMLIWFVADCCRK